MTTLLISRDPLKASSYERHDTDNVAQFIADYFEDVKPPTLKIYNGQPCEANDVTPRCEADIHMLDAYAGPLYVLVMPADGGLTLAAIIIGSIAVGVGAALLLAPPIPTQKGSFQQPSPNNSLASRENVPRIGKRIEDIYGTVRSYPTLLSSPYRIYENNREREIFYACIGRGEYSVSDIRDGDTPIADISGAGVEVYGPNSSPNSASPSPQLTVGNAINREVVNVKRITAINGQTAQAPNSSEYTSSSVVFDGNPASPYTSLMTVTSGIVNFTELFEIGDTAEISGASSVSGPSATYNLNGSFEVLGVGTTFLDLDTVGNAQWDALAADGTGETSTTSATVTKTNDRSIGPFIVDDPNMEYLIINFVALSGLYKTDGENQQGVGVNIKITITAVDASNTPTGTPEVFNRGLSGQVTSKESVGVTHEIRPSAISGRCQVEFERTTDTPFEEGFTIQDEVKIKDLYSVSSISQSDFGNVTTILAEIEATEGALAVKNRKLNCLARRLVRKRNSNGTFTGPQTTYNAGDVLIEVARDEYIGNRDLADIDAAGIAEEISANISYFGSSDGAEFNYTFDDDNLSFEDTYSVIANAVFCTPFRQGSILKVRFDGPQSEAAMLFNHRNTIPGSEKRSVRFGNLDNYDGVEFEYVEDETGEPKTILLPASGSVNRRRIESVGIVKDDQAYWHAAREWNKIRYQNTSDEREVLEHANLLTRKDYVLIADNTRPDTLDGEVLAQDGLTLELSQPHEMLSGETYSIWLGPFSDQTVESISITPGASDYEVVLGSSPTGTIITADADNVNPTKYIITAATDSRVTGFLVDEIDPQGGEENTVTLRCINYDSRYYENDGDPAP